MSSAAVWACPQCTLENDVINRRCGACDYENPEYHAPPQQQQSQAQQNVYSITGKPVHTLSEQIEELEDQQMADYQRESAKLQLQKLSKAAIQAAQNTHNSAERSDWKANSGSGSGQGSAHQSSYKQKVCPDWSRYGRCQKPSGQCDQLHGEIWLIQNLKDALERREEEDKAYSAHHPEYARAMAALKTASADAKTAPASSAQMLQAFQFEDDPTPPADSTAGGDSKTPPISPTQPSAKTPPTAAATATGSDMKQINLPASAKPAAAASSASGGVDQKSGDSKQQNAGAPKLKRTLSVGMKQYATLLDWMRSNGATMHKYMERTTNPAVAKFSDSYDLGGLIAAKQMPKDTRVLSVPMNLIIDEALAEQSEIVKRIRKSGIHCSSQHTYLASFLLQEKHSPGSYWHPYLDLLRMPEEYRSMALFYGDTERKELTGSYTLEMIDERLQNLKREYDNVCKAVPEYKIFSLREFAWARLVVITRVFGLSINGVKTSGLVPVADLIKHGARTCTWTWSDEAEAFIIDTIEPIAEGDKISLSFGRKCNSRWFVNYGFVLEQGNTEENEGRWGIDFLPFRSPPSKEFKGQLVPKPVPRVNQWRTPEVTPPPAASREMVEPLYDCLPLKQQMLDSRNASAWSDHIWQFTQWWGRSVEGRTPAWNEFMSSARFIVAQHIHLPLCNLIMGYSQNDNFKVVGLTPPITLENEKLALKEIIRMAQIKLDTFPTTMEQDVAILKAGQVSRKIKDCILMRLSEKRVYMHYREMAINALRLLDMPINELQSVFDEHFTYHHAGTLRDAFNTAETTRSAMAVAKANGKEKADPPRRYYTSLEYLYEDPRYSESPTLAWKHTHETYLAGYLCELLHLRRWNAYYQQMDMRMASAVGSLETIRRLIQSVPLVATDAAETKSQSTGSAGGASTADNKTESKSGRTWRRSPPAPQATCASNTVNDLLNTPLLNPVDMEVTPLHAAAVRGQVEVVHLLLTLGANPHIENSLGENAAEALLYTPHEQTWHYPPTAMYNSYRNFERHESYDPLQDEPHVPEHDPTNAALSEILGFSYFNQARKYALTNPVAKPVSKPTAPAPVVASASAGAPAHPLNRNQRRKIAKLKAKAAGPTLPTVSAAALAPTTSTTVTVTGGSTAVAAANEVPCPACTLLNDRKNKLCSICGEALPLDSHRAMLDWGDNHARLFATLECLIAFGVRSIDRKSFEPDAVPNGWGTELMNTIARGEKRFHDRRDEYRRAVLNGISNFDGDVSSVVVDYLLSTPPVGTFRRVRIPLAHKRRPSGSDNEDNGADFL